MLEDGRVIHTRNVTYDITDRESKVTSLTEPPTHEEANTDTGNTFTWVRKEQSATEVHQNPLAVGVKELPSKEPLVKELSSAPEIETPNTKMAKLGGFGDTVCF